jgi:hypothetical protein
MFHALNELLVFITLSAVVTALRNDANGARYDITETAQIVHDLTFGFGGDLTNIIDPMGSAHEHIPAACLN